MQGQRQAGPPVLARAVAASAKPRRPLAARGRQRGRRPGLSGHPCRVAAARLPPGDQAGAALEREKLQNHSKETTTRLRKPMRYQTWAMPQNHEPISPVSRMPFSETTAERRPIGRRGRHGAGRRRGPSPSAPPPVPPAPGRHAAPSASPRRIARDQLAFGVGGGGEVADRIDSFGNPGTERSGPIRMPAGPVALRADPGARPGRRPPRRSRRWCGSRCAPRRSRPALALQPVTKAPVSTSTPIRSSARRASAAEFGSGKVASTRGPPLHQHHPRRARIDPAELRAASRGGRSRRSRRPARHRSGRRRSR